MCQSGQTTAHPTPIPVWNTNVIECGTLFDHDRQFSLRSPDSHWLYHMRETHTNLSADDSGSTVWRT